ncbi:MAG: hypothetical protein BroJett011_12680 [Chloroflexota bacterium]|nr:MAG: hypothetical protein BroJett011_12680 [Chloroflexota bacterium]
MMKRIIPILIFLAAVGGAYGWFIRTPVTAQEPSGLLGSGTMEAETVVITAELGGRIIAVKVDEGDEVKAGQVLAELDKSDLLAQQTQLESAQATAKANLELVSASARPEDIATAEAQLAQTETARDGARLTWQQLAQVVNDPHELAAQINQAQAQMSEAEHNLELARVHLKRMEIQAEAAGRNQTTRAGGNEGLVQAEAAQYQLQAAQTGVQMAEVALAGTKQQVAHLIQIRDNPLPLIVQANAAEAAFRQAEAAVQAAQANLAAVKAGPTAEDIAVAQAQVREAEAGLKAVAVQLAKQSLTAPRDGLISRRMVEPGELAAPGTMLLELSDIETVDLTVYLPETQIGRVKLGQAARVYPDAYPYDVFEGTVSYIAHEAEFTPKNVQTQEERVNLVFAVKITLANADHRLRPGMPADAEILSTLQAGSVAAPSPAPSPQVTVTAPVTPTPVKVAATPTVVSTPEAVYAPPAAQAEIVSAGLNVRSGPGVTHPVIATLVKGDTVAVVKVDPASDWLQVKLPGDEETGWISSDPTYVSVRDTLETGQARPVKAEPTPTPTKAASATAKIVSAGLNVRSGPGLSHPVIVTLVRGDTAPVVKVDSATGWLQVQLPDGEKLGWISGDPAYVSVK